MASEPRISADVASEEIASPLGEAAAAAANPPPPTQGQRRIRLRTSENVRAELARTYRAFSAGTIDASAARTRGFLLQTLAAVIRDEKLAGIEEQLEELKAAGVLR